MEKIAKYAYRISIDAWHPKHQRSQHLWQ